MGFSQADIELVRNRTDIAEVISEYVRLKKAGRNYTGLCPFHSEKTPSFSVSREKQMYYCFGCGEGGTVFNFLMKKESLTFPESVELLARRAGVKLTPLRDTKEARRYREEKELFLEINTKAREYYLKNLQGEEGRAAREYLLSRGVEREMWTAFSLGYARPEGSGLRDYLARQGVNLSLVEKLGLVIPSRGGGKGLDRFRDRIIFPIEDLRGQVVGFGGRILRGAGGTGDRERFEPKFLNSPDSPIYQKGRNLYGVTQARNAIREKGTVVLVEGYFDLIILHQAGVKYTVATLGTALTLEQVGMLQSLGEKVVAIYDGDEAGRRAAWRSLGLFLEKGLSAEGVLLPEGLDPDDFVRKHGPEQLQTLIGRSDSLLGLFLQHLEARNGRSTAGRMKTLEESLPNIIKVGDPAVQGLFLKEISERIGVEETRVREKAETLRRQNRSRPGGEPAPSRRAPAEPGAQLPVSERLLMEIVLLDPFQIGKMAEEIEEFFSHPGLQELARMVGDTLKEGAKVEAAVLADRLSDREVKAWLSLWAVKGSELESLTPSGREKVVRDCFLRVHLVKLREAQINISGQIADAERKGDAGKIRALLLEKKDLIQKEKTLEQDLQRKVGGQNGGRV